MNGNWKPNGRTGRNDDHDYTWTEYENVALPGVVRIVRTNALGQGVVDFEVERT